MNKNPLLKFMGKKVLVTGHTGFKGGWLSKWLALIGANVYGISLPPSTDPNFFSLVLENEIHDSNFIDIRDINSLSSYILKIKPDYIFHLAAQPIVGKSYQNPIETITTNVIGTANILSAVQLLNTNCSVIIITSDKCYDNSEWIWGYRENDKLGGSDIYSASKACAEIVSNSFYKSFFSQGDSPVKIVTARAGNVIGGGDWSAGRIVPDCIRAWSNNQPVTLRSPYSTRPWQHVLEPLYGYLLLASTLDSNAELSGEAFNFGPISGSEIKVLDFVELLSQAWGGSVIIDESSKNFHEAHLLRLNCDKANSLIGWRPTLSLSEFVNMTNDWYQGHYNQGVNLKQLTEFQINFFSKIISNYKNE